MTSFSIVLPVRNGWPYVQECVGSILKQDWTDFELIVLDNNSSDGTLPWLRSLGDERIRIDTSQHSLSMVESWARIAHVAKREYMTIIGHDDALDTGYLSAIHALIERHPDAALYQTGFRMIDGDSKTIRTSKPVPERETPSQYMEGRFSYQRDITGTGIVMRSSAYDSMGGIPHFERLYFADDALWLSLLKKSYKVADPAVLFSVRLHGNKESASKPSSWPSFLKGLNQLSDFLDTYIAEQTETKAVADRIMPNFMLRYHRNIYILALIEACRAGKRIAPETIETFAQSIAKCAPQRAADFHRDSRIQAIEALNAMPTRRLVPMLWTAYNQLRTT